MNSVKLDRIERLLEQVKTGVQGPRRIILPDEWGGPGFWKTVPLVGPDGSECYPASQAPPRQPGEVWIGLPDDWGKLPGE